jgi:hypothetical protein
VEEFCPECHGNIVESRGIYYCSRCGLVIGQELVFSFSPMTTRPWKGSIFQRVGDASELPSALKRRASYIAMKLMKKFGVSPKIAAVAGVIAVQRESGIFLNIKAPKSTIRKAKSVLREYGKSVYSPKICTDIFVERLTAKCLELGIPIPKALEIYERHRKIFGSCKPSTAAFAIGYLLGMDLPRKRSAARIARKIEFMESFCGTGAVQEVEN